MEIKEIVEAGLKAQEVKLAAAIAKFEGQLAEKGKVDAEVKSEVKELSEQFKSVSSSLNAMAQKQAESTKGPVAVSAGDEFVKSAQFAALVKGDVQRARLEVKNTVTSTGDTVQEAQRPGIIPGSFVPLSVRGVLRSIPVATNMVSAIREKVWTPGAAETEQGGAKPQSAIEFEEFNVPIQTVAHWIKISNQLLADAPAVVAYIETRLRDGLAQRIDAQLLNGNGSAPNLSGLTDAGNFTAYTPTAGDNLIDAINRIKYEMWTAGNTPDTVIVNPADWGTVERLREGSGSGTYLFGMPGAMAASNPFGLRVVLSPYLAPGKVLVAKLDNSAVVFNRSGSVIEMGYVNDDFTKNLITIRAEERLGLSIDRPAGVYYGDYTA